MSGDRRPPPGGKVLLVGMMAAGKTSVGRELAARWGWRLLDSDERVQARTGRTVPEIFAADGEAAFRAEESAVLAEAAAAAPGVVVSVAGGAVLDPANREVIRAAGPVVWLRADVATLARRVGDGEGRPLLGDDPPEAIARLYPQREPFYAEVADVVIDVDGLSVDEVADRIEAALAADGGSAP